MPCSGKEAKMGSEKKLKIVKWTTGLDRSVIGRAKQLYPAFGDDFNDMPHEDFNRLCTKQTKLS